jgi:transcriptional regulator with XRE-family HTH domain
MNLEQIFGEELRKIREEKGLSQEQLGFESEYHRTYISQLERGQKSTSLKAVFRIAQALGVKPSALIARVEARDL